MMLEFPSLAEEECLMLLPEGDYEFFVKDAIEHVSKNTGNESIKLTLEILDSKNIPHTIFDYLTPAFKKKFKHFFDATGMIEQYAKGQLSAEECKGKFGSAKVKIQASDGVYDAKNIINDYIKLNGLAPVTGKPKDHDPDLNDDIPF